MVNESETNKLFITDLLLNHHPTIAKTIIETCCMHNTEVSIINHANDYWCRDFMPLQINKNKFVQFVYDPSYYKHKKYRHLKTDVEEHNNSLAGEIIFSDIVLDGGNICFYNHTAIISEKVFIDNPLYPKQTLIHELTNHLELDKIVFVPTVPYDITGHSDGMVKFINEDTIFLNDFSKICSKPYLNKLHRALKGFNVVPMTNELHKNKLKDDATGDYINMIVVKDLIFLSAYGNTSDEVAFRTVEAAFPSHDIKQIKTNALAAKGGVLHCATWNLYEKENGTPSHKF